MTHNERIEKILGGIRPMLVMQGKDVKLVEASDDRVALSLSGFCGGCSCSQDYLDGLEEMLKEEFPQAKVEFEIV